jgi:predicted DNA-binding transcriptional regulator AlpA
MRKHRLTITPKELSGLPDFAGLSRSSIYRHYKKIREKTGPPKYRHLNYAEVADYLGVNRSRLIIFLE